MWSLAWPWALLALPLPLIARKLMSESPTLQDAGLKVPSLSFFETLTRRPDSERLLSWRFWLAALAWIFLVAAAAPQVPPPLVDQLKTGGKLIIPEGERTGEQRLVLYRKTAQGIERHAGETVAFVPLIGRHGWPVA